MAPSSIMVYLQDNSFLLGAQGRRANSARTVCQRRAGEGRAVDSGRRASGAHVNALRHDIDACQRV